MARDWRAVAARGSVIGMIGMIGDVGDDGDDGSGSGSGNSSGNSNGNEVNGGPVRSRRVGRRNP
jgi:hypothetical protein